MHFKAHIEINAQTSVNSSSEKPRSIVTITHCHHAGNSCKMEDQGCSRCEKNRTAPHRNFYPLAPHRTAPQLFKNFAHRTAPHRSSSKISHTAPHRTAKISKNRALHRTAPHRTAPHRTTPHRTAPQCTALYSTKMLLRTRLHKV